MKNRIGIVGGGQLARMLTFEAKKLGFHVTVLDPTPQSPAGQVADEQIVGGYKDEKATRELAKESDVLTVDAEFVNDDVLEQIDKTGIAVYPSPQTIRVIKDKLLQKQFLKKAKIPVADFVEIETEDDIFAAIAKFDFPVLLKARFDAYDGKGNAVIKNTKDIETALKKLAGRKLYVEKFVPFTKELAVMVARSTKGEIKVYPVVETIHRNNICDTVIAPASLGNATLKKTKDLATKVMQKLRGAGVFGIEMFLTADGRVWVNELAPRVHNSGHYTIEATVTSQFEQHIRAISGLPLGETSLIVPASVMVNILGAREGVVQLKGVADALKIPNVSVHIYGKKETRKERKMGHITVIGDSVEECLRKARKARRLISI